MILSSFVIAVNNILQFFYKNVTFCKFNMKLDEFDYYWVIAIAILSRGLCPLFTYFMFKAFDMYDYISIMDKKIFAQRLKIEREKNGLTQKQVAIEMGITERGYQYYESFTDFREPAASILFSLANALDISVDYLLNRTSNSISHKS